MLQASGCAANGFSPSLGVPGRHEALDGPNVSPIPMLGGPAPPHRGTREATANVCPGRGLDRPSFKTDKVAGGNREVSRWIDKYLGMGEWVMDQSVAIAGSSGWFERTR